MLRRRVLIGRIKSLNVFHHRARRAARFRAAKLSPITLTHLQRLEAESIHMMREVVAE